MTVFLVFAALIGAVVLAILLRPLWSGSGRPTEPGAFAIEAAKR